MITPAIPLLFCPTFSHVIGHCVFRDVRVRKSQSDCYLQMRKMLGGEKIKIKNKMLNGRDSSHYFHTWLKDIGEFTTTGILTVSQKIKAIYIYFFKCQNHPLLRILKQTQKAFLLMCKTIIHNMPLTFHILPHRLLSHVFIPTVKTNICILSLQPTGNYYVLNDIFCETSIMMIVNNYIVLGVPVWLSQKNVRLLISGS